MKSQFTQESEIILQGAIDLLNKTFEDSRKLSKELDDIIYVTPANRRKVDRDRRSNE